MKKRIKKKQIRMKNKALIKAFPFLEPRNCWTGKRLEDYDYSWTELDNMPDGWRKAFGILLCEDLKKALIEANYLDKYSITQIKEKYGSLRWYDNGNSENGMMILDDYEYLSGATCIQCGAVGVPMTDDGWIQPLCEDCFNRYKRRAKALGARMAEYKEIICDEKPFEPFYKIKRFGKDGDKVIERDVRYIIKRIKPRFLKEVSLMADLP